MQVALGQVNPTVGDLTGNAARMLEQARTAAARGASLIVYPELAISGYPPRDLVDKLTFLQACEGAVQRLALDAARLPIALIVGFPRPSTKPDGKQAMNSAAVLQGGKVTFIQDKMLLPTYDVFDEARHFSPAERQQVVEIAGRRVAIAICEDAWNDKQFWPRRLYPRDPVEELMAQGADLLVSLNASPYHQGKRAIRERLFQALAQRHRVPVVAVNQVGGNDQLLFDGTSMAFTAQGELMAQGASFAEDLVLVDVAAGTGERHDTFTDECHAVYEALVMGTRDYLTKCGFRRALIGLSGGIDSSLVAAIAVEALGAENVIGVGMPGPFSSDHSVQDARDMAANLGIRFELISINNGYQAMVQTLEPVFAGTGRDVTEENLQSRLRGVTLMALSNKFNALVLTTGNKSELAVGYCTLYGDMCGGLAVISDVPKVLVYHLCRVANQRRPGAIPENVFIKPPSAELRPDQKDTDSLPPYEVLDPILEAYVERNESPRQIAESQNVPVDLVRDLCRKVDRNEYKRQQAAPGLKVTTKAFGIGRRFPIAQRFAE